MSPNISQIEPSEMAVGVLTPSAARNIIFGESASEFEALAKAVTEFWQPQDIIEQLLLGDFIQAEWELRRLRRLVAAAFKAGRPFALSELHGYTADRFCDSPFATGRYQESLAAIFKKGHTPDVMDAHVLLKNSAAFESFDKRAAVLEIRRGAAWEKVERRRSDMKTVSSPALGESHS